MFLLQVPLIVTVVWATNKLKIKIVKLFKIMENLIKRGVIFP